MRICIQIGLWLVLAGTVLGQGGFKKRHFLSGVEFATCREVVEAPSGNLLAMGITFDSLTWLPHFVMMGLDPFGDTLWTRRYGGPALRFIDNDMHFRAPMVCDSSGIYLALLAWDGVNPRTFGVLMKCDYNGDTLWQKKLPSADSLEDVIPQGICKSVDGGLLITGLFQWWGATATLKAMVLKTDINGNELWRKKISKAVPEVQDGKSIVQDKISKKIFVAGYQYIGNSSSWLPHGSLLILDSLGTKLNQFAYNAEVFTELILLKDGNILVAGNINSNSTLGNFDRYRTYLVKITTSGVKLWEKYIDIVSPFNMGCNLVEASDGEITVATMLDTLINHNIMEEIRVRVHRLDNNGNLKRSRTVGFGFFDEAPICINATKSGGFLLGVRESMGTPPYPFYIIKIDNNGCDTSEAYCRLQDALGLEEEDAGGFSVYPSPFQEQLIVESDQPGQISIFSSEGRVLYTGEITAGKTMISTLTLAAGIYIAECRSGDSVYRTRLVKTD